MGHISIFDGLQDTAVTSKTKANPLQQKPRLLESEGGPSCLVMQEYQSWKETGCVSPWKFPNNEQNIDGKVEKKGHLRGLQLCPLKHGQRAVARAAAMWCGGGYECCIPPFSRF